MFCLLLLKTFFYILFRFSQHWRRQGEKLGEKMCNNNNLYIMIHIKSDYCSLLLCVFVWNVGQSGCVCVCICLIMTIIRTMHLFLYHFFKLHSNLSPSSVCFFFLLIHYIALFLLETYTSRLN